MLKKISAMIILMLAAIAMQLPADAQAAYSPFYETILQENTLYRQADIDPSQYLDADNLSFKTLSDEITAGLTNDYAKVKAIHEWMCANIFYDYDIYTQQDSGQIIYNEATAQKLAGMSLYDHLMQYKRGVCSYYATIFSELVRAQHIPCMTVRGYTVSAGVTDPTSATDSDSDKWNSVNSAASEANHDWNEVYVDGRWVIIDVTWDCQNRYQNGQYTQNQHLDTYFDITDNMLAQDHRILSYGRGQHVEKRTNLAPFTDVTTDDYFYAPVKWALEKGITAGTSSDTFSPNDFCTNGQILTFLWRNAGAPIVDAPSLASSYKNDTYYPAIAWAYTQGILRQNDRFQSDTPCTRSQAITFLWRAERSPQAATIPAFGDVPTDAPYTAALAWALENGITAGTTATTFSPNTICTRAQIISFLYNGARAEQP